MNDRTVSEATRPVGHARCGSYATAIASGYLLRVKNPVHPVDGFVDLCCRFIPDGDGVNRTGFHYFAHGCLALLRCGESAFAHKLHAHNAGALRMDFLNV